MNTMPKLEYDDVTIRASLLDDGAVVRVPPSPTPQQSWLCVSPDIINWGEQPAPGPEILLTTGSAVSAYQSRPAPAFARNYIYARLFNPSATPASGSVYLYRAPASLTLWPDQWASNGLMTANGADHVAACEVPAGGFSAPGEPFVWTPKPSAGFYAQALIARVVTEKHPNPLPQTPMITIDQLVAAQIDVPGFVSANTALIPAEVGNFNETVHLNWRGAPQKLTFFMVVRNAPQGTKMMLRSFPAAPFDPPMAGLFRATEDVSQPYGSKQPVIIPINTTSPSDDWRGYVMYTAWNDTAAFPADCSFALWAALQYDDLPPEKMQGAVFDPHAMGVSAEALDDPNKNKKWVVFGTHQIRVAP